MILLFHLFLSQEQHFHKKAFLLNRASRYYSPTPKETSLKCFQKKQVYKLFLLKASYHQLSACKLCSLNETNHMIPGIIVILGPTRAGKTEQKSDRSLNWDLFQFYFGLKSTFSEPFPSILYLSPPILFLLKKKESNN